MYHKHVSVEGIFLKNYREGVFLATRASVNAENIISHDSWK